MLAMLRGKAFSQTDPRPQQGCWVITKTLKTICFLLKKENNNKQNDKF